MGALQVAARDGLKHVVRQMLQFGADVNNRTNGATALHWAASNGRKGVVKILLEFGASINATDPCGLTPLLATVGSRHGHIYCIRDHGSEEKRSEVIELLIQNGADIKTGPEQETPLGNLLEFWQPSKTIVRLLMKKGADPNKLDRDGISPLHKAACLYDSTQAEALVRLMRMYGGDVMQKTAPLGGTLLHYCAKKLPEYSLRSMQQTKHLFNFGIDVNALDVNGDTALHIAIRGLKGRFAQALLMHGAHTNLVNIANETPISIAQNLSNRGNRLGTRLFKLLEGWELDVEQ
jgi:ankyrin repeat protein